MIIVESVLAATIVYSATRRQRPEEELQHLLSHTSKMFCVASGLTVEGQLTKDLEHIQGVGDVTIIQNSTGYEVNVSMETFEFSSYEKVIQKELELLEKFPESKFVFNVSFTEHSRGSVPVLDAA